MNIFRLEDRRAQGTSGQPPRGIARQRLMHPAYPSTEEVTNVA